MSKTKKYLLMLLLGASSAFTANAQMTLPAAVEMAIKKNNGIKSYQKALESKEEQVSVSWGRFAPTLTLEATYTHLDDKLDIDLAPIRSAMIQLQAADQVSLANLQSVITKGTPLTQQEQGAVMQQATAKLEQALPAFVSTMKEQNYPAARLTLKQPIFTGGKIVAGVDAAEAQRDMAKVKLDGETEGLISNVVSYYLNVLLAQENLKVRQSVYEGVKKHQERAEKLMLQGVIANNDKLRADVAFAEAERNLNEAKEKLNIAKSALSSVLELSEEDMQNLSENLEFANINLDIKSFIQDSKANNTNLLQLRAAGKALNAKADAKNADYYPTVYGFGFYNAFDNYLSALDPKWGVGVGLQYDIFKGFQDKNEYESNKAEAESIEYLAKDAERKIELLVRSQYMNMNLAKDSYLKLETTKTQAEENLRLNSKRFEEGLGTSLEALDAQLALEGVLLKRVAALSEYYQNMAALYQTIGKTSEFVNFWANNIK